ncbi:Pectinesterase 5 [Colletotrichum chlorophyti]|uniref:pectinesterase n=1 Tax=Colletotrichum chlorophyti TaxID=708187 RepID=A0A1Q8RX73_9PEZI|nr:Pectinesterase 5 [Colletotrichum chlorophyti]
MERAEGPSTPDLIEWNRPLSPWGEANAEALAADGAEADLEAEHHVSVSATASVVSDTLPSVYFTIHRIRRLILASIDDPYTLDQLREPRMNSLVVRPLVDRLYDPDDPSVVYCLLANRIQFLRQHTSAAHHTVNVARAALCELVASRVLRRYHEDHPGQIGLLILAHILVEGFDPFQGAPEEVESECRQLQWPVQRRDGHEKKLTTLELAIISESKLFLSSSACQRLVDAVWQGVVTYEPLSFVDILPDHYEYASVSLYDPHRAPLLDDRRLIVPWIRQVTELLQFITLVVFYILTMVNRSSPHLSGWECLFAIYTAGWTLNEFAAIIEHGWAVHSQTLWSFLDTTFCFIYSCYVLARICDVLGYGGVIADGYGVHVLCIAAPVLLTRVAFTIMPDNIVFIAMHAMMKDFTRLTFIAIWCFTGFFLALQWLVGSNAATSGISGRSSLGWYETCKWLIWTWFGLDGTGIDRSDEFHPIFGPVLMIAFAFLGNILFLTILVALLSNTFSKIIADAPAEILFRRAVLTFAGVKSDSIFAYPPPFNLLALAVLLPLKSVLSSRSFHDLNITLIRALNAPALLVISVLERRRLARPRRQRSQSLMYWNFSGFNPHGDIHAVFKVEPPPGVERELEELDNLSDLGVAESELGSRVSGDFARTRPSSKALVVDATGKQPNSFPTLKDAVTALKNTTAEQTIFIQPGTYSEQVRIPNHLGPITIQGYTCDARSYAGNQATLTGNLSRQVANLTSNDQTATLRLWSDNIKIYNLNIANTFGQADKNGQALAVSAQATNLGFYGCQFTGYQDTIYANEGRQIYAKSYINGAVDFVFGLRAAAWFESCDIETIGKGYITANGRDADNNTSFYVFNNANVTGTSGPGSTFLGRPWRTFARVVFQNSFLSDVVKPIGWSTWDAVSPTDNLFFKEFNNSGPGSEGIRANFSSKLDAPIKPVDILGKGFKKEWWVDASYL